MNASWCWYGNRVAAISDRPAEIHRNEHGLHRDGGPAISWRDGWALWMLNGVTVPQWLSEQRDGEIDPTQLHAIDNAEVRREFVRKVGIERICHKLGSTTVDSRTVTIADGSHQYDLIELDAGNGERWRYLRMDNPSVPEVVHVEGVPSECGTVLAALNFRNGLSELQIDDNHGADWYQQGDVILRPKEATRFKRFPIVLT